MQAYPLHPVSQKHMQKHILMMMMLKSLYNMEHHIITETQSHITTITDIISIRINTTTHGDSIDTQNHCHHQDITHIIGIMQLHTIITAIMQLHQDITGIIITTGIIQDHQGITQALQDTVDISEEEDDN